MPRRLPAIKEDLASDDAEVRRWSAALAMLGMSADTEGLSEAEQMLVLPQACIRESVFAAAARMLTLIGQL